jgi:hypothetical protein
MSRWTHPAWADPKGCGTPFRAPSTLAKCRDPKDEGAAEAVWT